MLFLVKRLYWSSKTHISLEPIFPIIWHYPKMITYLCKGIWGFVFLLQSNETRYISFKSNFPREKKLLLSSLFFFTLMTKNISCFFSSIKLFSFWNSDLLTVHLPKGKKIFEYCCNTSSHTYSVCNLDNLKIDQKLIYWCIMQMSCFVRNL